MCGIAGFAGPRRRPLLEAMTRSLRHRGPDGVGFFEGDEASLGSQRLAIIDLEAGPQPVTSEDGGVVVVFNGEIYNFQELRRELEGKGHRFKTRTDTEVIAHLYEEHGEKALERLSGMFAIALWDARRKTLLLARDPMGVKPLYYAVLGRKLYFGSEIKALLAAPEVSREVDLESLCEYFEFLYIAAPRTIYRGIRKLGPGEALTWKDGKVSSRTFWEPRIGGGDMSRSEALSKLDGLLQRVVSDQLVAEVLVGLFLSGGIDSTTLAYQLSRLGRAPEAFCAYFSSGGEDYNEVDKARVVARHFGLRLTELCIEPSVEEILDTLIDAFDEPLADSSSLPTYWLSQLARQRVTVALTGIGGDEVFGGYPRYLGAKLLPAYQAVPRAARELIGVGARIIPGRFSGRNVPGWARRFLSSDARLSENVYSGWLDHLDDTDRRSLLTPALRAALPQHSQVSAAFEHFHGDFLKRVQAVDLRTYLPDDLLAHADRMSMKVGLELRVPLCDLRLVEFALGLPPEFQVRGVTLKPLLKDLLKDKVPLEIVAQPKQGFMIPLGPWFRGELKPVAQWGIAGLKRRGLLRGAGMEHVLQEHVSGWRNRTDVLWSWVLLERWLERYVPDFRGDSPPPRARRPVKVLMVSDEIFPDSGGGGLGRGAWQESLQLKARGHDVRLFCFDRVGGRAREEVIDGLKVYRLDASRSYKNPLAFPLLAASARADLTKIFSDFRPDVVIGQSPLATWLVQSSPEVEGSRFIYRYNSSWPEEFSIDRPGLWHLPGRLVRRWIERRVIARAFDVAAISDFMNANFVGHFRLPAVTLSAGVDFERFRPGDKKEARSRLGVDGAPLLVTVRNLRPRMGWEVLFGAVERLRAEHPGLRVEIVGTGPLEAELRRDLRERGLEGVVRLAGRVEDDELPLYYQAADLFVLPTSKLEGLGLVLLEALACGTKCVGTPIGGIPEVLRPIDPGWVAKEATPEAFAEAIRRGLASPLGQAELRDLARARYGWDKMAAGLESLFTPRPRLLHLVTRLDYGGSAENVLLSCAAAKREGMDAVVASGPSSLPTASSDGVPVVVLPALGRELSPWRDARAFFQILSLLRRWRPDILHTHSSKAGLLGRWAARLLRAFEAGPSVVIHTPHGHVFYGYFGRWKTALFTWIEKASASAADSLIALSEGEKRDHLARGVGLAAQWSVVPSGVGLERAAEPAEGLEIEPGDVVVGCVARLEPVKGVDVLLEAAALASPKTRRPFRVVIVGDGPERASLEARAAALGISGRVVFEGYRADPVPLMKAMQVYVQPSRNEGMGKALVLAQALGLPAAASRVCGIPDVVQDGLTGLLVPPDDPAALAEALTVLVDDEALRARLGAAAARRMREPDETGQRSFSVEAMTARLSKLYRAALWALALAALARFPAGAVTLNVAMHLHSDASHVGTEPLEGLASRAQAAGVDVLIPTDTFVADWRYGLWPLRGLIRERVVDRSVLSFGVERYLEKIRDLRARFPRLTIIPGVEAAAYYRWSGAPWRRLTINDWNRHILVIGPEAADAYRRLPVAGNAAGGRLAPFLFWPLLPLTLGAAGWLATRRMRFAYLAVLGLVFLADAWPFREQASAYARETPWSPYQRLIDAARESGALVVWAHPDAPNWQQGASAGRVDARTQPYPEALSRTTGYTGFGALKEGMRGAASPGGSWDRELKLYVDGSRSRPVWAFGELDFRRPEETRIDSVRMVVDAASRRPADVLDALSKGRFYSVQVAERALALKRFRLTGRGGSAGSGETLTGPREPNLEVELAYADGGKGEGSLEIVRDGELVARETVAIPGSYSFPQADDAPRTYYRLVVRGGANDVLVSNPIFSFE